MPTKNIIVVDIDSTLYHFIDLFVKVAREQFNITVDPEPRQWDAVGAPFKDLKDLQNCFTACFTKEMIFYGQPYEGSVEVLQNLVDRGYEVHYYTDRVKSAEESTMEWLIHHGYPTPENLHVCLDKRQDLLKVRHRVRTIIDDRPRTLIWAKYELDMYDVFSIKHPYNLNLVDIPGIHIRDTWGELGEILFDKYPLRKTRTKV